MTLTGLVAANNLGDVVDIEKTWDNIGNSISATVFVPSPTLDLNFAGNKSLIDNVSGQNLITFTRPSTGTFIDSNGLIQTAASGVPRFDHNPVTGESLGLLVEEARINYQTSSQLGNANNNNGIAVTSVTGLPGAFSSALRFTSNGGYDLRVGYPSAATGIGIALSIYARIGSQGSRFFIRNGTGPFVVFSLSTLTIARNDFSNGRIENAGNGWYRCSVTLTDNGAGYLIGPTISSAEMDSNAGTDIILTGLQVEAGTFPTSYIPTSGSQATRAADVVSITGTNFSSWYNQSQGTTLIHTRNINSADYSIAPLIGYDGNGSLWDNIQEYGLRYNSSATTFEAVLRDSSAGNIQLIKSGDVRASSRAVIALNASQFAYTRDGLSVEQASTSGPMSSVSRLTWQYTGPGPRQSSRIARLTYYPVRLTNLTLQALTTSGPISSFPYSFSIKGRDILALKEVNKTSTRDFIFIKGLFSRAQPRLTTASQYPSSGVALRDAAMPKFAPVTTGNYLFSSGLTLSGATVQINGTNAQSIATSPFTGSGATVPLLFAGLRPQANWRISETMASGVVASPESAIPIETSDFLLFMKAGQS